MLILYIKNKSKESYIFAPTTAWKYKGTNSCVIEMYSLKECKDVHVCDQTFNLLDMKYDSNGLWFIHTCS